jgi:hypothetical protein
MSHYFSVYCGSFSRVLKSQTFIEPELSLLARFVNILGCQFVWKSLLSMTFMPIDMLFLEILTWSNICPSIVFLPVAENEEVEHLSKLVQVWNGMAWVTFGVTF